MNIQINHIQENAYLYILPNVVIYNIDLDNSRMAEGWINLRHLYNIESDQHILF